MKGEIMEEELDFSFVRNESNQEESIHIIPIKGGEFYKFFADKWLINLSNPKDSMLFCSLPLEFKAEEKSPYERDGEPAFVTTKQRVQDLVNALCNGLGFKPE